MNLKTKTSSALVVLTMASMLFASACSTKTVIELSLMAVIDGSAAILTTAASIQNPVAGVVTAVDYARNASLAASESLTEFQSSDSTPVKIAIITGYFSKLIAPTIGQTNSSLLAIGITALSQAIQHFLAQVKGPAATAHSLTLGKSPALMIPMRIHVRDLQRKAEANIVTADRLHFLLVK